MIYEGNNSFCGGGGVSLKVQKFLRGFEKNPQSLTWFEISVLIWSNKVIKHVKNAIIHKEKFY